MQKIIIVAIIILVVTQIVYSDEGSSYIAFPFDVSGSMKKHGFDKAKEQVIEYMYTLPAGTCFWIIPFSENDMPGYEAELTETNRDATLKEAENFIGNLKVGGNRGETYGFHTNLDEGIDAGKLAVIQQPGAGKRSIVLIADGISEPDAHHNTVNIQELAKKVPDSVNLYLLDLAIGDEQLPAEWRKSVGSIQGFQVPQSTVILVPVHAADLKDTLNQLSVEKPTAQEQTTAKPPVPKPSLLRRILPLVAIFIFLVLLSYLIIKASNKIGQSRRKMKGIIQQKEALIKRNTPQKATPSMVLSIAGKTKSFPIKPFASIRFGTQETFDFPITDPDKGHIDGWLKVNESGKVALINGASTFPFVINGKIDVPRGKQQILPNHAAIQISKRLNLDFRVELFTDTVVANSVDDLIKKYQPKGVAQQ